MKTFSLFLFISAITVIIILFSWFSEGKILQNTSEENLDIFNASKTAEVSSTVWYPIGTGLKVPFLAQRYPSFLFLGYLDKLGLPPFLIQAIFIGIIMLAGLISMYFLLINIFKMPWVYAVFGSLFYLLNLYSMSSVWKRLLYNQYIVWAYLPLFLFSWIKWLEERKIRWLVLLLLSSLIFSYTFAHPAFILTFWIVAAAFTFYKSWVNKNKISNVLHILLYSGVALLAWFIVSIWWIYPLFTSASSFSEGAPAAQLNLASLIGVSSYQDTKEIVLLRQSWVFGKDHEWFDFYKNPLVYMISIAILSIVVLGLLKSRQGLKYRGFSIVLMFLGWFISKGTNLPLGKEFYAFLFSTFPLTAALRNPYEKFGNVFLLAYTVFFVFGLTWIAKKIKSNTTKGLFLGGSFLLFCGILVYPMWNGSVFPARHRLEVPDYYTEANNFLNSIKSDRVFHIPFVLNFRVLTYSWGYIAEDPSPNLFDSSTVSKTGVPIFNNIYLKIPEMMGDDNFSKVLGMLGVDNVILHKDIVFPEVNIASASALIKNWDGISSEKKTGELLIFSLDKSLVKPLIYPVDAVVKVGSLEEGLDFVLDGIDSNKSVFVQEEVQVEETNALPKISYKKLSNVYYDINIENVEKPFILVFNNTFDSKWKLKIEGIEEDKHFMVNGFANGWLVNKVGNYSARINLKVWPWE